MPVPTPTIFHDAAAYQYAASQPTVKLATWYYGTRMVITETAHGRTVGQPVFYYQGLSGVVSGLVDNTRYFVAAVLDANRYTIRTSKNAAELNYPVATAQMQVDGSLLLVRASHGLTGAEALYVGSTGTVIPALVGADATPVFIFSVPNANSFTLTLDGLTIMRYPPATVSIASPCVVTFAAHGLSPGAAVRFGTTGALPTGLAALTTYYVRDVLSTSTFTLAASVGGPAVNTSGTQSGTHSLDSGQMSGTITYADAGIDNGNMSPPIPLWQRAIRLFSGASGTVVGYVPDGDRISMPLPSNVIVPLRVTTLEPSSSQILLLG